MGQIQPPPYTRDLKATKRQVLNCLAALLPFKPKVHLSVQRYHADAQDLAHREFDDTLRSVYGTSVQVNNPEVGHLQWFDLNHPAICAKPYLRPFTDITLEELIHFYELLGVDLSVRACDLVRPVSSFVSEVIEAQNKINSLLRFNSYGALILGFPVSTDVLASAFSYLDSILVDYRGFIARDLAIPFQLHPVSEH